MAEDLGNVSEQFIQLLSKHERQLSAYILCLVPNWSDAEDIAQEVKVLLWQQFANYDPTKDFGAWSRAIAYYQILSYRHRLAKRFHFSEETLKELADEVDADVQRLSERKNAMEKCLQRLSEAQRNLIMQWHANQVNTKQLAAAIGRSFEATRKAVLRIRHLLADCITRSIQQELA